MSAPRKITPKMSLDECEVEVFYTRAALKADPDAEDLLPVTDGWMALVDGARATDRASREARADTDAARTVVNNRFDRACTRFGDELFLAVDKDRTSARWTTFFSGAVSQFVRQALAKQVTRVQEGWLKSKDSVLEKHRGDLTKWSAASDKAVKQTVGLATVRGEARVSREQMAEDLTRERDGLHDLLSARARDRGLPRDWPDQFFRKVSRSGGAAEDEEGGEEGKEEPGEG